LQQAPWTFGPSRSMGVLKSRCYVILISATDDAGEALRTHNDNQAWKAYKKDNFEACTENGLTNEALRNAPSWSFAAAAPHLTNTPLIVITSDDGYAPESQALAAARAVAGGASPATTIHFAADHCLQCLPAGAPGSRHRLIATNDGPLRQFLPVEKV
jgi:hypothetical protein